MEGFRLWGRSCCDTDTRGWAHARQDLSVQTLCSQSSGQGSVQWRDSAVSEQCLHLKTFLVVAVHSRARARALYTCTRSQAQVEAQACVIKVPLVSFFLYVQLFLFCFSAIPILVCLFVVYPVLYVLQPKDWFDFQNMKDWQEDKSSVVSVSEQMDVSPLYCLSHKWPTTFCFSSAGGLPGWDAPTKQPHVQKHTRFAVNNRNRSMEKYPPEAGQFPPVLFHHITVLFDIRHSPIWN